MRKPFNILIYYHRNVKKYSTLQILRFILDIQQRLIGAIFLLIVLVKDIPFIILVYWVYIVYFYVTPKNAKTRIAPASAPSSGRPMRRRRADCFCSRSSAGAAPAESA